MTEESISENQEEKKHQLEVCTGKSCEKMEIAIVRNGLREIKNFPNCSAKETIEKIVKASPDGGIKEVR